MKFIESRAASYEAIIELEPWNETMTSNIPHFYESLAAAIPTLGKHECTEGKKGGFLRGVLKGDNLAHIMEHIIIELMHMVDTGKEYYYGKTRKLAAQERTYSVRYGAPDALTGELAAILAKDIVKRLIDKEPVDINDYVKMLKDPMELLADDSKAELLDSAQSIGTIHQLDRRSRDIWPRGEKKRIELSEEQKRNIIYVFKKIGNHLNYISKFWSFTLRVFAGNFGQIITNKLELLNFDKFANFILKNEFDKFAKAARRASRKVGSFRIPEIIILHSIWLYKDALVGYIRDAFDDEDFIKSTEVNFDDLFQLLLQQVSAGLLELKNLKPAEVREFRELMTIEGIIMVVDSDDFARSTCRNILGLGGHEVVAAANGSQALEKFNEKSEEIELVILDVRLSDNTYQNIINQLKIKKPNIKILLLSGLKNNDEFQELLTDSSIDYLNKPFTAEALGIKVHDLLVN